MSHCIWYMWISEGHCFLDFVLNNYSTKFGCVTTYLVTNSHPGVVVYTRSGTNLQLTKDSWKEAISTAVNLCLYI